MAERLSIEAAVARFEPRDTLGIPLGTGQPAALLKALGERTDWQDLRVYGALLLVGTELFSHPGVHYLSGLLRPDRARPARRRRQHQLRPGRLPPLCSAAGGAGAAGDGDCGGEPRRNGGAASRCMQAAPRPR